jgi:hypothetical protein
LPCRSHARQHSKADYYTPLFGPVLAFTFEAVIPFEEFPKTACADEWSAMVRSNWVLGASIAEPARSSHGGLLITSCSSFAKGRRFGDRKRFGLQHISKIFSRAVMEESAQIWAVDFARSTRRRFREVERGSSKESRIGDLHATWMASWLMVERSRESMLWVWAYVFLLVSDLDPLALLIGDAPTPRSSIVRLGGLDGIWSTPAREEVAALFGVGTTARDGPIAAFSRTVRSALALDKLPALLRSMGLSTPLTTRHLWASYDGAGPEDHRVTRQAETMRLDLCFGPFWTDQADVSAVEMFKRITFINRTCGDQLLSALINRSGSAGLSSLLPPAGIALAIAEPLSVALQPHMPLTTTWQATDFNLRIVVRSHEAEVDLRTWALRLLARYQHASGASLLSLLSSVICADQHLPLAFTQASPSTSSRAWSDRRTSTRSGKSTTPTRR